MIQLEILLTELCLCNIKKKVNLKAWNLLLCYMAETENVSTFYSNDILGSMYQSGI